VLEGGNGSQFTSRDFRTHLSTRGMTHRRGGYRDPEFQAFIESWFGQFKKRCDPATAAPRPLNGIVELHRRLARRYGNRGNYRLRVLLVAGGLELTPPEVR
jgi:transposase InsO family protein